MKKYYLLFLLLFIPINIFASTDCNGKLDYKNYNKEFINTLDYKSDELINEGLIMEERTINVRKDNDPLNVIEIKNLTLDGNSRDVISIEIYYDDELVNYSLDNYENATKVSISNTSHFYLYKNASFSLINDSKDFSYDKLKIKISSIGSAVTGFDLILKNKISNIPVIFEHITNPEMENITFSENYKLLNTEEKVLYDYYKYTYNCIEEKNSALPIVSTLKKFTSKNKEPKKENFEKDILSKKNKIEKKKSPKISKNKNNGVSFSSIKNKSNKKYLKQHNNYLYYYYLTLPFLIILYFMFIFKLIKNKPKNITSFVETVEV